jgi:cation:H+ antiporter
MTMTTALAAAVFLGGAMTSLATSWLLVSRLERIGGRLGLSEALLGLAAALAADAPEVTSAIAAIADHQQQLGTGVVIGSNVFNLAALLGVGAVVAGRISLHRRVVVLGGTVAMWIAAVCLGVVAGLVPAAVGLVAALAGMALYALILGSGPQQLARLPLPVRWTRWLRSAVAEDEQELQDAIRPSAPRRGDPAVAVAALLVVIAASVMMERAASALGSRFALPEIVVGGLVLAAVTSLPNAVAAVYLAGRGRGAATFSTALNSNALNVTVGLLVPAAVTGLGRLTGQGALVAVWYAGLTLVVLTWAYLRRGISRAAGALVIAAYLAFAGCLLMSHYLPWHADMVAIAAGAVLAVAFGARLAVAGLRAGRRPARRAAGFARLRRLAAAQSLLPGWRVGRVWNSAMTATVIVAAVDAALGPRVVLIGLLIAGPCWALLTGRWVPTALTGLWVTGLAVLLGIPDGIWATSTQFAFLAAVAAVAAACSVAAAIISARRARGIR